ncbi:dickkopf-related protein 3-like [Gastrophryne carolinensis]
MAVLLCGLFVILLSTSSSPASLSVEEHSTPDEARLALDGFSISSQVKLCNDSSDCPKNQYCYSSHYPPECLQCKGNEMDCGQDEECCSEQVCSWGRCTEGLSSGAGGTRCDPAEEQCAPGFCCSKTETNPFPECVPLLSEGDPCHIQTSSLLKPLSFGVDYGASLGYCSCAEGLVCSSRGNLISTCEKPDDIVDFTNYRDDPLFPTIVRREEDLTYYDTDLVPWPGQDDQLGFVDFGRAAEEAEAKLQLSADEANHLEEDNIQLEDHADKPEDPSQVDFQELKRLASEMGQYFGADFY